MATSVRILETFEYFPDGSEETKVIYRAGAEPELDDAVAKQFIGAGLAVAIGGTIPASKSKSAAPAAANEGEPA
jgi:hypothetical protein